MVAVEIEAALPCPCFFGEDSCSFVFSVALLERWRCQHKKFSLAGSPPQKEEFYFPFGE
jgi:hypothetical protein